MDSKMDTVFISMDQIHLFIMKDTGNQIRNMDKEGLHSKMDNIQDIGLMIKDMDKEN